MSELFVEGKVFKILAPVTGEGANGAWKKQDFVIETGDQYPKKVCFNCWGDKTSMIDSLKDGELVKVSFDPQSREYNERWFTDLRAWKIEKLSGSGSSAAAQPAPEFDGELPPPPSKDDLPF